MIRRVVVTAGVAVLVAAACMTAPGLVRSVREHERLARDRADAARTVTAIRSFINGDQWRTGNGLAIPRAASHGNGVLTLQSSPTVADYDGVLFSDQQFGRSHQTTSTAISVEGVDGTTGSVSIEQRSTSSDPSRVMDVLHFGSNPNTDYLLPARADPRIATSPWLVALASRAGTGIGCGAPGRAAFCEILAAVQDSRNSHPLPPLDTFSTTGTVTTWRTYACLAALSAEHVWTLPATLPASADRILFPVTITYTSHATPNLNGRPISATVNGETIIGASRLALTLSWTEHPSREQLLPPAPTRPEYTVISSEQRLALDTRYTGDLTPRNR